MEHWPKRVWIPLLGCFPSLYILEKWYLNFPFKFARDCEKTLNDSMWKRNLFLLLRPWSLGFDPMTKMVSIKLLWVKLLGILMELWHKFSLKLIVNKIGRFIFLDHESKYMINERINHIYVELYLREGIPCFLEIA